MRDQTIEDHSIRAIVERLARSTVGIAVENNTWIGTGTMISMGQERYVLTSNESVKQGVTRTLELLGIGFVRAIPDKAENVTHALQGNRLPAES